MEHFFPQIQVKTNKKKSSPKVEQIFSPNSSGHLRSDAHQSQIIEGNADADHTQTIGGNTAKLLGGYSQIIGGIYPPQISAPLAECLRKDFPNKLYVPKQMREDQLDDLELEGPITLRILDGTA